MKLTPFFKEGIQFECQGSGKGCVSHGEYGEVYMTLEDRKRMAKDLGMKLAPFTAKYCHQVDSVWALKPNPAGGDCIFLKNKKCSVYLGRPTQCRTWPFWPDVMNARTWKKEIASFCPGVGKGRTHTAEEMILAATEQTESEKALRQERAENIKKARRS
ncbi:MAG: YkgJ family cysteine cluster protein [Bdellovibrionales bacterium]|nr:YkgJ family cysteine cluster protein [Bdellovibrionales bacterium]